MFRNSQDPSMQPSDMATTVKVSPSQSHVRINMAAGPNSHLMSTALGVASMIAWCLCETPQVWTNHQLQSSQVRAR